MSKMLPSSVSGEFRRMIQEASRGREDGFKTASRSKEARAFEREDSDEVDETFARDSVECWSL